MSGAASSPARIGSGRPSRRLARRAPASVRRIGNADAMAVHHLPALPPREQQDADPRSATGPGPRVDVHGETAGEDEVGVAVLVFHSRSRARLRGRQPPYEAGAWPTILPSASSNASGLKGLVT